MRNRNSELQTALTICFVVCMLVSNIITAKQVQFPLGITMTGAIFIFPITYILSDVFSECYGYRWSRVTCYMAFAANLFMALVFQFVINALVNEHACQSSDKIRIIKIFFVNFRTLRSFVVFSFDKNFLHG